MYRTLKAEMVVEKFDNGITIRREDTDDFPESINVVVIKGEEHIRIGEEIWEDLYNIMDHSGDNKVRIKIEYEAIKESL